MEMLYSGQVFWEWLTPRSFSGLFGLRFFGV
jgi:hypothetical protein